MQMTEPKYGDLNHGETVEVNVVMGAQLRAIVRSALLHVRSAINNVASSPGDALKIVDDELDKWPLSVTDEPEDTLAEWLYKRFGFIQGRSEVWDNLDEVDQKFWEHEAAAVRRAVGRGGFRSAKKDPGTLLSTPINELHQEAKEATEVRHLRPLDLQNAESMGEAIRIAVGAASTCWSHLEGAGVFQSETALDISNQLERHVNRYLRLLSGQIMERHQKLGDLLQKYFNSGVPMVSIRQVQDVMAGRSNPEEYESALQPRPEHKPAPRTPGFDGPEGTEWPGGKARG